MSCGCCNLTAKVWPKHENCEEIDEKLDNGHIIHLLHYKKKTSSQPKNDQSKNNDNNLNHLADTSEKNNKNDTQLHPQFEKSISKSQIDVIQTELDFLANEAKFLSKNDDQKTQETDLKFTAIKQTSEYLNSNDKNKIEKVTPTDADIKILGNHQKAVKYINDTLNYTIDFVRKTDNKNVIKENGYAVMRRKRLKMFGKDITLGQSNEQQNHEKPVLFLIHGVGGSSEIWQKQIDYFVNNEYEIVVPDLIGHGKTEKIEDKKSYEFINIATDLLNIFDRYAKTENVIIGHSYGCSFAAYMAKMRPMNIKKIILISGGSPHPLEYHSPLLSIPKFMLASIRPFINCHFFCSAFFTCKTACEYTSRSFNVSTDVLKNIMMGQNWPEGNEKFYGSIRQKVLLIEGGKDEYVPWEESFDFLMLLYDSYLIVTENGSHMAIVEQPNLINEIIHLFLYQT